MRAHRLVSVSHESLRFTVHTLYYARSLTLSILFIRFVFTSPLSFFRVHLYIYIPLSLRYEPANFLNRLTRFQDRFLRLFFIDVDGDVGWMTKILFFFFFFF